MTCLDCKIAEIITIQAMIQPYSELLIKPYSISDNNDYLLHASFAKKQVKYFL